MFPFTTNIKGLPLCLILGDELSNNKSNLKSSLLENIRRLGKNIALGAQEKQWKN